MTLDELHAVIRTLDKAHHLLCDAMVSLEDDRKDQKWAIYEIAGNVSDLIHSMTRDLNSSLDAGYLPR